MLLRIKSFGKSQTGRRIQSRHSAGGDRYNRLEDLACLNSSKAVYKTKCAFIPYEKFRVKRMSRTFLERIRSILKQKCASKPF